MNLIISEFCTIREAYPKFSIINKDGVDIICGELDLVDDNGVFCSSYTIEIHPHPSYPYQFPHVFEKGGRIPVNIDWHVFPDGHCCIKAVPEEMMICRKGIRLADFIEQQVKPYFFNQLFREIHGYFYKERPHGLQADIDYYGEILGSKDPLFILNTLKFILSRKEPKRTDKCFCGSGNKYRYCHRLAYRKLGKFSDDNLRNLIGRLLI